MSTHRRHRDAERFERRGINVLIVIAASAWFYAGYQLAAAAFN